MRILRELTSAATRAVDRLLPETLDYANVHFVFLGTAAAVMSTGTVYGIFSGQWHIFGQVMVWLWVIWGFLVYLCGALALANIKPKPVLNPSILAIRLTALLRFGRGTLLVLIGAGLGLYVSATGEYFASDAQWAKFNFDRSVAELPPYARASMYGAFSLLTLLPGIACFVILYFGLLTAFDLVRARRVGRLRSAAVLRVSLMKAYPKFQRHPIGRLLPRWFLQLMHPGAVSAAACISFLSALLWLRNG